MSIHPYYPRHLELNDYQPNQRTSIQLLLTVGSIVGTILIGSFYAAKRQRQHVKNSDYFYFCWFILCGFLHCGFESYWVLYRDQIASRTDLFAELFREYAHSDSRYMISDPLLVALESMTVFVWGPLCFASAWTWWQESNHYIFYQLLASLGHCFTCTLYFVLDIPTGFQHCNPHPFYFWVYFVAFNAPWIIVPCTILYYNSRIILHSLDLYHENKNTDTNKTKNA
ncbi:Emopamil binding protein-domain-containing protein [Halteromyces radiatus]|uniref:Emopamil binding protein-domain-containing protein n=1 Tax=Halteromyces radiatus TaxID=101107 RepID=UPI002220EF32|nr:Emopamil binding protein-domain-containing protein [Halteromyces radiatus]KAI8086729.1 Emopamil binding protein-domain-containing protein [Halteromyces radiatus]